MLSLASPGSSYKRIGSFALSKCFLHLRLYPEGEMEGLLPPVPTPAILPPQQNNALLGEPEDKK